MQVQMGSTDSWFSRQCSAVIGVMVSCFVIAVALKSAESSVLTLSVLAKSLGILEANARTDPLLALRTQFDLLQNFCTQILGRGDWTSIEIRPRSLPFGAKIKYFMTVAVANVSVIVPTLNEEKYLSRCLNSLRGQLYSKPFEIIVVDGGSHDGTVRIAKDLADKVLLEPNRPVGAARNLGAEAAEGDILAFIDADTVASKNWLSVIEQAFADKTIVGVTGPTFPYNGGIRDQITYRLWTIFLQRILLSAGMPHVIGFNCAYRKNLFLKVGGFDEVSVMSEDIRLASKMRRLGRILFEQHMSAMTSPRRFHRFGHGYVAALYLVNGFTTLLLNRSSKSYPAVR
jgi:hypothetical protein